MTTYVITVKKIDHDVTFTEQRWNKIVDEIDEKHDSLYAYVPINITRDVETQIFEQTVEELDLPKLVLTINSKENNYEPQST